MNRRIVLILITVALVPGCTIVGNSLKAVGEIAQGMVDVPKALLGVKTGDEIREDRLRKQVFEARRELKAKEEETRAVNLKIAKLERANRKMKNCLPYSGSRGVMALVIDEQCDRKNF